MQEVQGKERAQGTGLGSEVSHRLQGGCCALQGHYCNAKLPLYFSPSFSSGVDFLGPSTSIGQTWECGSRACVGCPEHMAEEKGHQGSVRGYLGLSTVSRQA